ncbi:unnamed protein product, partial [Rotaria sp. Silwood2]
PATGVTVAGGNGAGAGSNQLNGPRAVAASNQNGAVYVSDTLNHRVQRWAPGASCGITIVGSPNGLSGNSPSLLFNPAGLVLDTNDTHLFVCHVGNNLVLRFRLS